VRFRLELPARNQLTCTRRQHIRPILEQIMVCKFVYNQNMGRLRLQEKEERFRYQSGLRKGPTGFSCKEIRLNVMRQANSKKKRVWACGGGRQACSAPESRSERKDRQCVLPLSFINLSSSAIVLPLLRLQHDQSRVTRRRTTFNMRRYSTLLSPGNERRLCNVRCYTASQIFVVWRTGQHNISLWNSFPLFLPLG